MSSCEIYRRKKAEETSLETTTQETNLDVTTQRTNLDPPMDGCTKGSRSFRTILRRKKVEEVTGLPRSSIYHKMQQGEFPKPVRLGKRAVGWWSSDIEQWLAEREEVA